MTESLLSNNPVILIGFIIALALSAFAIFKKTHFAVCAIGVVIFVGTLIYALLMGIDLYEAGAVATVFLIVNLLPLWKKRGK